MSAPAFRSAATATLATTTGTTLTIDKPTGTVEGDHMTAQIRHREALTSTPTDWIQVGTTITDSVSFQSIWQKVAGASEPANYAWVQANTVGRMSGGIVTHYNVDATTPVNATAQEATASQPATPNNTTQVRAPAVTTTVADTMVMRFWGVQRGVAAEDTGIVAPSGTERWRITYSTANRQVITMAEAAQAVAGSSGTSIGVPTSTHTFADASRNAFTVALAPAAAAGGDLLLRMMNEGLYTGMTA